MTAWIVIDVTATQVSVPLCTSQTYKLDQKSEWLSIISEERCEMWHLVCMKALPTDL